MDEDNADRRADEEVDRIYRFLGQYIAIFQWVEAQLDQILLLAYGHENWTETQRKLAGMRNVDRIDAVEAIVKAPSPFGRRLGRPEWIEDFSTLIMRLRQEGQRRNGIVHSQYLFEFVDAGMPPIRSHRRKKDGVAGFDQISLDSEWTEEVLQDLAILAFDMSQARIQLVHWYAPEAMS